MRNKKLKQICPNCGSEVVAPILYGMPLMDEEMERCLENREVYLGGCCVSENDPQYHCFACGEDFGYSAEQNESEDEKP